MPSRQAKHWCWTLNNYTDEEIQSLDALGNELPGVTYLIFGKEQGEQGTPHLQGYIAFKDRKTLRATKALISERAHMEPCKGNPKQNRDYCSKEGDFKEFGKLPGGQGSRTDLQQVFNAIKEGATLREIAEQDPAAMVRYGTGILRLRQFFRPDKHRVPEIWTLWGKTGTGKTRRVWEYADLTQLWVHPGDRWFDGYDGHRAVLFDDFDGGWFKISYLLKLLDRYTFQVPVKGAYAWWCPHTIYITSNLHPREWYPNAKEEHKRALMRRLTEFGHIEECLRY